MDRLEDALREALRRKQAPEGFAERVLARQAAASAWDRFRLRMEPASLRWAGAAALALVLLAGYQYGAEQRRRAAGEAAKQQVLTALRITAAKLEHTRAKVEKAVRLETLVPAAEGGATRP